MDHNRLVSTFYLHLEAFPFYCKAKIHHLLEIDDPHDSYHALPYACLDSFLVVLELFGESTEFAQ